MRSVLVMLAKRTFHLALLLLVVSAITFALTRSLGSPASLLAGQQATEASIGSLEREMGLDRPLPEQYFRYLGALVQGNLGVSRFTYQPVLSDIGDRFPATLELAAFGLLLGLCWAVPLGLMAAIRPGGLADRVLGPVSGQIGLSVPSFAIGLILIYLLYFRFGLVPAPLGRLGPAAEAPPEVTGLFTVDALLANRPDILRSSLAHLFLPGLTLALGFSPPIYQLTRDTARTVLRSDFVRAARSYGISAREIHTRRVLRHVLPPIMTSAALTFGYLLSGTILVEVVFAWPGVGQYAVQALNRLDYEPILGLVLLGTLVYVVLFLVTDLVQAAIDPRVRRS
jgi:peptide/nickel transport system permease protein